MNIATRLFDTCALTLRKNKLLPKYYRRELYNSMWLDIVQQRPIPGTANRAGIFIEDALISWSQWDMRPSRINTFWNVILPTGMESNQIIFMARNNFRYKLGQAISLVNSSVRINKWQMHKKHYLNSSDDSLIKR